MPRYVAFLRAINVGGRVIKMAALRDLFQQLGFDGVETFIASGNVIFESGEEDTDALAAKIEAHLKGTLGYEVATFLRTDEQIAEIARCRPFDGPALDSAGAFVVGFLGAPLDEAAESRLMSLRTDTDDFHTKDSEIYWLCQTRQSESDFSTAVFEKTVGVRSTFRGMKTIERLAAKYPRL